MRDVSTHHSQALKLCVPAFATKQESARSLCPLESSNGCGSGGATITEHFQRAKALASS